MSEDWDIDAYRTSFESNDHWELRKSFMLAHKDKFSEDRIVCLAQAFINIELLGCRYPEETMRTIAELAKGVVEPYREKKKNAIKRTFVPASDAASAKVKGMEKFQSVVEKKKSKNKKKNKGRKKKIKKMPINKTKFLKKGKQGNIKSGKESQTYSKFIGNIDQEVKVNTTLTDDQSLNVFENSKSSAEPENSEVQVQKLTGPFADFVLFLYEEHPITLLQVNATMNNCAIRFQYHKDREKTVCSVILNDDYFLAKFVANNEKNSRNLAAAEALKKLQCLCYTIKSKSKFFSDTTVDYSSFVKTSSEEQSKEATANINIGEKIMKLMGWKGGGLGSNQQGIVEPISLDLHTHRKRFGLGSKMNLFEFKRKAKRFITSWLEQKTHKDLIFTTQFTKEERSILHKIAQNLALRSRSYGKNNERHLVISKKINPREIVEELKRDGGSSDKYELLIP